MNDDQKEREPVAQEAADLVALYEHLESSMQDVHAMIERLDETLADASEEWTSKAAHEFRDDWQNGFRPSLAKLCQSLAAAGTDVAFHHHKLVERSEGNGSAGDLEPLTSPR